MEDNNVEMVLGFSKEKGMETCRLNQNYIITTSWRCGTYGFFCKDL
jgi:hypothetical protein